MDPVAIANLGLGWLGLGQITSFDDPGRAPELLKAQFDGLRRAVLEDRDWTFATTRRVLPKDATAPVFGYIARYLIPPDILRVVTVRVAGRDTDWIREGSYILAQTDGATVELVGIEDVQDSGRFSPGFCQALGARIAADLCGALTEDAGLAVRLYQLYQHKLRDAAANDGRQGRSRKMDSSSIALRRR